MVLQLGFQIKLQRRLGFLGCRTFRVCGRSVNATVRVAVHGCVIPATDIRSLCCPCILVRVVGEPHALVAVLTPVTVFHVGDYITPLGSRVGSQEHQLGTSSPLLQLRQRTFAVEKCDATTLREKRLSKDTSI